VVGVSDLDGVEREGGGGSRHGEGVGMGGSEWGRHVEG
jgi:hypothetical protein